MTIKSVDYVTKVLVEEAYDRLGKLARTGLTISEAISEVSHSMDLTAKETRLLEERAKKAPPKSYVVAPWKSDNSDQTMDPDILGPEDDSEKTMPQAMPKATSSKEFTPGMPSLPDMDSLTFPKPRTPAVDPAGASPLTIYFGKDEELDQAIGILMYKGIAWQTKGDQNNEFFIEFEDEESLRDAQESLKRRWDFLSKEPLRIAAIEFDNLSDYEKVLDFMQKQGMTLEVVDLGEISEDPEEAKEASEKAAKQAKKMGSLLAPSDSPGTSYQTVPKAKDVPDLDPSDISARQLRVRKRWK